MKLKEIHRTATFAWSPSASLPWLATGTVSGALDESFSNDSQLELWSPNFMDKDEYDLGGEGQTGSKASISISSRFNRVAWGQPAADRTKGIIAAGMENGELGLWDPEKIVAKADPAECLVTKNTTHQGAVRGLDFNPIQTNLLSSGGVNGEIYIWDLKDPTKPYSPGSRSSKLHDITSLAWNRQVQYILGSSSSSGYTVVWDLRNKREVVALAYSGTGGGFGGPAGHPMDGGRKGMSDVAWHPDNATRLVTSSEDDTSPVLLVWDLRNARAPEKILTGHEKGVLSLAWCTQDADLLLSCGKDNRVLCWNPQSSEIIGELPSADNWAFDVQWCPRNPDLLAASYFDGTIGVHSLQTVNETAESAQTSAVEAQPDGSDVFDVPGFSRTTQPTLSLKQPPKWLRRPISASFGYGGKLASVSNLPSATGKHQSSVVHLRKVVTEESVISRAKKLLAAIDAQGLKAYAEEKCGDPSAQGDAGETWKALLSLFQAGARDELIQLLGFSKSEIAGRVSEAVERLKASTAQSQDEHDDTVAPIPREPVVSFVEPESDGNFTPGDAEAEDADAAAELTPSEQSTSVTSDASRSTQQVDGESTTTAPSLFDDQIGTPQTDAAADFFSTMGALGGSSSHDTVRVPHHNYAHDSSVAATVGSRPSSAASEPLKNNGFRIYPSDESDVDRLVTKALVLGNFESAVSLCLSSARYADAILLAVKGGADLLQRTQKAYFEIRTTSLPYLRLFQSIVTDDLDDIVQNADLQEWQEIFVVLCTFAKPDDFANLAEQLGQRLQFQATLAKRADNDGAGEFRKNALLVYLAAGRLEKVVNIWIEEMAEQEAQLLGDHDEKGSARYSAHAQALQTLMDKVAVFRAATNYVDSDLADSSDTAAIRAYKLSGLYDRYFEYADLLAAQGLLPEATKILELTPKAYQGSSGSDEAFAVAKERILRARDVSNVPTPQASTSTAPAPSAGSSSSQYGYGQYSAPTQHPAASRLTTVVPPMQSSYPSYAPNGSIPSASDPYAPRGSTPSTQPYQPAAPAQPYPQNPYTASPYAPPAHVAVPAPPPPLSGTSAPPPGLPPPKKRDNSGWNDAPVIQDRRPPSAAQGGKAAVITSPFPNSPAPPTPPMHGQPPSALPPPPRPGSVQRNSPQMMQSPPFGGPPRSQPGLAPPPGRAFSPQGGMPPPPPSQFPPQQRPPQHIPPPPRGLSPQQVQAQRGPPPTHFPPQRQPGPPGPGQYAQPPAPGPAGPYARATPPPQGGHPAPPPPLGPYAPSTNMARQAPPAGGPPPGPHGMLSQNGARGPPPGGPAGPPGPMGPPGSAQRPPPTPKGPPPPKYPPGDRSHIPESSQRAFQILSQELNRLKQTTPPQQKRMVDETERRLNVLFDALNCETLSKPVVDQLNEMTEAMAARNAQGALAIHAQLLVNGSSTDDIGLWMSAAKQVIMRL